MAGIEISMDTSAVREALTDLGTRTLPYIIKRALNDTGDDLLKAERDEIASVFDRPTPYVLNSFFIQEATEDNLELQLRPREFGGGVPGYKILWAEIFGGQRQAKSHELALRRAGIMREDEFAVPGEGVALDAYGNMPGALIETILSQVKAASFDTSGYFANVTERSKKRRSIKPTYFVMRNRPLADGIYWRAAPGNRYATKRIVPILIFVRAPNYDERFPFADTAIKIAKNNFFQHLYERFQRYGSDLSAGISSSLGG